MRTLRALVAAAVLSLSSLAGAQTSATEAAATQLFDEGMKLMNEGKLSEACPKLARSQSIAPSGGTLFNLAECYEKNGQSASAWVAWKQLAARAADAGKKDVEATATERASKLEGRLAKLTVSVASPDTEGLEIKRDGEALDRAQWGVAAPIDPGSHKIEATAPGKHPMSVSVLVKPSDPTAQVRIPPLTGKAEEPPPSQPRDDQAQAGGKSSVQKTIGIVGMALGSVGVGLGAFFGVTAMNKNSDAKDHCRTDTRCDAQGVSLGQDAKNAATVSTVLFVAGGVLAAGSAVLFLSAPSSSASPTPEPRQQASRLRLGVGPTAGGASAVVQGGW
jgi:hypothetical protein